MNCKHCGKEIAENSAFCQYCGGKQDNDATENIIQEVSVGGFKAEINEDTVYESSSSIGSFSVDDSAEWVELDDNKEYTLLELNTYINNGVAKLQKMAKEFPDVKKFSRSKLASAIPPAGLVGSLIESVQDKKVMRYLGTKIYNNMTYEEIGYYMLKAAEDLSKAQIKVQKIVAPSVPDYYDNVRKIMDVLLKCLEEWKNISLDAYKEAIKLPSGEEASLGLQVEFWVHKELVNMEIPEKEYVIVKWNVKHVTEGNGCMVFIAITFATSLLAACSLL